MLINFYQNKIVEAGCDEAGRGCLAGPVFAASVILPVHFYHPDLNDSKQVSEKNRNYLRKFIEENAIAWSVATASQTEIDELNILNASILAMHRATYNLNQPPELLIVDGNRFHPYTVGRDLRNRMIIPKTIQHQCIIKGDSKYMSIAAASILAKTHRDEFMKNIHLKYPEYGWNKNMGYGTQKHRDAILTMGITEYHRKTFRLLKP